MRPDDQVIVLGSEETDATGGLEPIRASSTWMVLAPIAVVVLVLLVTVLIPRPETETTATPEGLEAPTDPPPASVSSTTTVPPPDEPPVALDVSRTDLKATGTVTSIDHGPDGWLAVTAGSGAAVAHLSQDALVWEPVTLHGFVGDEPKAAVGEGIMAVVGGNVSLGQERAQHVGAVSADGGASWATIDHAGWFVVRDVAIVGEDIYVAGAVSDDEAFAWEGTGTAGLWTVDVAGGSLTPIELTDADANGEARAIVATPYGPMVYGVVAGEPARWSMDGRARELIVPENVPGQAFLTVTWTDRGLLSLVGNQPDSGSRHTWSSDDGVRWEATLAPLPVPMSSLVLASNGQIHGTLSGQEGVFLGDHGVVDRSELDELSSEEYVWLPSVGVGDGLSVFGGQAGFEPILLIQGARVRPVEIMPTPVSGEPRWRSELTIDLAIQGLGEGSAWPIGSAMFGRSSYVATGTNVFELDSTRGLIVERLFGCRWRSV